MSPTPVVSETLSKILDRIIDIRRHLHAFPELSHEEYATSEYITGILEQEGLVVKKGIAKTGLLVEIGPPSANRKIAFRCDLDALPVHEETGADYASKKPGIMHACGHDVHTAIVTGTLLVLNKMADRLNGRIKFIFQPAEEALSGGAELVVQEGIVDDVEAVFGIHADPSLKSGTFGLKDDAMMASVDFFDVSIKGKGGHGARPHETADTIFVAAQVIQAIYQIQGRLFSSLENPTVISVGSIHGGTAHNIIPEVCTFAGTFRTFDERNRSKMRSLIEQAAKETSRMFGAECGIKITPNAPPVINDPALGRIIEKTIKEIFGETAIEKLKYPMTASEDFAYYREKSPIYFLRFGVSSGPETSYPLHNAKFNVDEAAIGRTVELMSHVLLRYFE